MFNCAKILSCIIPCRKSLGICYSVSLELQAEAPSTFESISQILLYVEQGHANKTRKRNVLYTLCFPLLSDCFLKYEIGLTFFGIIIIPCMCVSMSIQYIR